MFGADDRSLPALPNHVVCKQDSHVHGWMIQARTRLRRNSVRRFDRTMIARRMELTSKQQCKVHVSDFGVPQAVTACKRPPTQIRTLAFVFRHAVYGRQGHALLFE